MLLLQRNGKYLRYEISQLPHIEQCTLYKCIQNTLFSITACAYCQLKLKNYHWEILMTCVIIWRYVSLGLKFWTKEMTLRSQLTQSLILEEPVSITTAFVHILVPMFIFPVTLRMSHAITTNNTQKVAKSCQWLPAREVVASKCVKLWKDEAIHKECLAS